MRRPIGVRILLRDPGDCLFELVTGWRQRDAIRQVRSSVAQGEELRLQQVGATERAQNERSPAEQRLKPRKMMIEGSNGGLRVHFDGIGLTDTLEDPIGTRLLFAA
jgi:hypothetical protein